jgi:N-methylhydantoinase B
MYRGCSGIDYRLRARSMMFGTVIADGVRYPPGRGVLGGADGRVNTMEVHSPDGSVATYEKAGPLVIAEDTVIRMRSGGGGGYGPASKRDPRAVHQDIAASHMTEAAARELYPHAF